MNSLLNTTSNNSEFNEERKELRQEYLALLLVATVPFLIISILRAAAWRTAPGLFYSWPVAVCLSLGLALSNSYRNRRPRIASWIYILTLVMANALELFYFTYGPAPYLFAVIVIAAGLLLSETEAVIADILVILAMGYVTSVTSLSENLWPMLQAGFLVVLSGFVTWLGTHQLYTVLRWEWQSTKQAIEETHKAQAHRAEMMHLNKELDGAYIRLERMNQMLVLARKEAEEARMLKVQFANAVSHELRSPLNMIIGFSDMMVNAPEVYGAQPWPPRLKNHIQQIYQSSQHLSQLVDDVLDLARIDAYRLALNKQRLPIESAIMEAVDITRGLYDARNLYLKLDIQPDLPPLLYDRTRIRQVLLNLLTNAQRFTRQGGITIRALQQGDEIIVSVIDTGAGIESEELPKLFREFSQLEGSIYRQGQGFGLGLAISKQLVELHGGRMMVESTLGKGSVFSFALLIDPGLAAEIVHGTANDERFWTQLEEEASERKAVIVCAPDSTARRLVSTNLTAYEVTWISDESELPQAVTDQQPAAIVRIGQPASDGDPGDRVSRQASQLNGIPLIDCQLPGLTHNPWISSLSDYLVKPISRRKLLDSLHRLNRDIMRVLIIEDEAPMREFLSLTISNGYPRSAIRLAENGQVAIHYVNELSPDLILLDLTLPDIDGLILAEKLYEMTRGEAAIVAVTARDYPTKQGVEECDMITCARLGRFSQIELERVLNAMLEAFSPSARFTESGAAIEGTLIT